MEELFTAQEVSTIEDKDAFGLTGGMGSGKSTVSRGLAKLGAVIVDADAIVHELQQPGQPVLTNMAEILGEGILNEDGSLNRAVAAQKLFNNSELRGEIRSMMNIPIKARMLEQVEHAAPDELVVLDVPLLLEAGWHTLPLRGIMVVDTPQQLAISRLVKYRDFTVEEAQARLAIQMNQDQRLSHADFVIRNHSTEAALAESINQAWRWMQTARNIGANVIEAEQNA